MSSVIWKPVKNASPESAGQRHQEQILAACFVALMALAVAAVLLGTRWGVGIATGSMDFVRTSRGTRALSYRSPLFVGLLKLLSMASKDPISAWRWLAAILLASHVLLAGFIVRRYTPP